MAASSSSNFDEQLPIVIDDDAIDPSPMAVDDLSTEYPAYLGEPMSLTDSSWKQIDMSGASRRILSQTPTGLYSTCAGGRSYDASTIMKQAGATLRDVVHEVLGNLHPCALKLAEFRRLTGAEAPHQSVPLLLHSIPSVEPCYDPPSVQLATPLRPDQLAGLSFLLQADEPKSMDVTHRVVVQMSPPSMAVGGLAKIRGSSRLHNLYNNKEKAELATFPLSKLHKILYLPGSISSLHNIENAERALATLVWKFDDLELQDDDRQPYTATFMLKHLTAVSSPGTGACICSVGVRVKLGQEDVASNITTDDVGVVMQYNDDASVVVCFPTCFTWRGSVSQLIATEDPVNVTTVEILVHVQYRLRASISAQKMGWGKTPMFVALLKLACERAASQGQHYRALVVVPAGIHRQWVLEIRRWLGATEASLKWFVTPDKRFRFWAPVDMADFKEVSADRAMKVHVVVMPLTLFEKVPTKSESERPELFDLKGVEWNHYIIDEVQDLASKKRSLHQAVLAVRRQTTHLISGTPQQGLGSRGAANLMLLMNASICPCSKTLLYAFEGDLHAEAAATRFFQTFARTDMSPFNVPIEEKLVHVELSAEEKVIYNLLVQQGKSQQELLDKCCCFLSEESQSCYQEIGVLIQKLTTSLQGKMSKARGHAALFVVLARLMIAANVRGARGRLNNRRQGLTCNAERKDHWEAGKKEVDAIYDDLSHKNTAFLVKLIKPSHVRGTRTQELLCVGEDDEQAFKARMVALSDLGVAADLLPRGGDAQLDLSEFHRLHFDVDLLNRAFGEQLDGFLGSDYASIGSSKKPLDYLIASRQRLAEEGGACSICLDDLLGGEPTCMTKCGHFFHTSCVNDSLKATRQCPICRQALIEGDLYSSAAPCVDPYANFGSKIKCMITQLRDLMQNRPGERVLLFAQHASMRKKLQEAFTAFEVPYLTLAGSARVQGKAITRWQDGNDAKDFLMMLSCQEHNSGLTLTAAQHVMFAQPMLADTLEEAEDMEKQAIGRINRLGQKAASLTVWRVITRGTMEERLAEKQAEARARGSDAAGGCSPSKRPRTE